MLANFLDQVWLKKTINERNLMVFCRYLVCNSAEFPHPADGILKKITRHSISYSIVVHKRLSRVIKTQLLKNVMKIKSHYKRKKIGKSR